MSNSPNLARSHLYTVRLWREELGDGQWEWRGAVKYITTGEERYFRDWGGLKAIMAELTGEIIPDATKDSALWHDPTMV
ncbi:MAG: hypothetical protein R3C14_44770 [Caldilineaceae bacterium]